MDREQVMSWLEGLSQDDWRLFHSDSEVSNIAKDAIALLKEQEADISALKASYKELAEKGEIVVRCKDCAHGSLWCGNIKCVKPGMEKYEMDLHPVNWFCADGERRTDDA